MNLNQFFVCVKNDGYASTLKQWNVYQKVESAAAKAMHRIGVIDETGHVGFYPETCFQLAKYTSEQICAIHDIERIANKYKDPAQKPQLENLLQSAL